MPRLALAIVVSWFVSLFVLRTALHWWRTGSTGLKGFSGAVGSLEWNAGLLASLGLVLAGLAPVGALQGWLGSTLWFANETAHGFGAALALGGIGGAFAAQLAMGESWRIGVDDAERTELVTEGPYAWVRNPIFSCMLVSGVGLALLLPTSLSFAALALTFAGIEIQVRAVEEPYLARTHGRAYADYAARVGRFLPGWGCPFHRGVDA